jgi:hypothetical protein
LAQRWRLGGVGGVGGWAGERCGCVGACRPAAHHPIIPSTAGHALDQKRLQQPLYRHPWEDVLYTS